MPEHCGRVKSFGLAVQVERGKVKSQEERERREGMEVQVSTGYWLPGGAWTVREEIENTIKIFLCTCAACISDVKFWEERKIGSSEKAKLLSN